MRTCLDAQGDDLALQLGAGLLEGADGCHLVSPWLFRARDHRGLDGDRQAAGDRRRTRLRAGAQRRMAAERLSWLARNGRTGVPALAGWQAQGKKVSPPPLRPVDRGFAVLRPDQAIKRPRGSRATQPAWEKTWRTWSAQEAKLSGRKNRNAGVQKGGRSYPGPDAALASQTRVCRPKASLPPGRSASEKRDRVIAIRPADAGSAGQPQPKI
jgi:hypothetical protein